jgi:YCII-related domain
LRETGGAEQGRPGIAGNIRHAAAEGPGPVRTPSTQHWPKNFLGDLSNSGPAVRLGNDGWPTGPPADSYRRSHDPVFGCRSPPRRLRPVRRRGCGNGTRYRRAQRGDAGGGVRFFAGGLRPVKDAKSLRARPDGKVVITDGPYLETKEHIGGFWILEAASLDEALAWGRKAVIACRAPVEVRPFY